MRFVSRAAACAVLVAGTGPPAGAVGQSPTSPATYDEWYAAVRALAPDPTRGAPVSDVVLRRDAATIELSSGDLHLLGAGDRTVGAVFVGAGRFRFTPPTRVEREHLARLFESESLDRPITTAVLFFTDETLAELASALTWGDHPVPSNARREVEEALKYLSDDDGWMHRDLMLPLLNDAPGFFHAHVAESRGDPLMLTIDPLSEEEVSLARKARRTPGQVREVASRFHRAEDYESGASASQASLDLVRTPSYEIESTIAPNLDFAARATLVVERMATGRRWVPFHLFGELEVDSVRWEDGGAVPFARPPESTDLWLDLSGAPSDPARLSVYYHGELLDRYRDFWVHVKSSNNWFPVYAFQRDVRYRLTFHAPERFTVTAVGTLVSETADGDMVTRVWETPVVRQITFNLGEFTEHAVDDPRIPSLRVQVAENAHRALRGLASDAGVFLLQQRDMEEQVSADLANSFAFFGQAFGPAPVDTFVATEIPSFHGEAYPGLVLLSWSTFQWTSEKGADDAFRAHEVAHQWWGIGVQPATYHDWWLSEGFAEFAGLWYMGRVRGSVELFTKRLETSRKALLERRDEAAPIWLGTRAGTSEHPDDYQLVVYQKGAWVLHMLRNLFVDLDTGSDQAFVAMMNDFYATHFGQLATTGQFKAVVERHAGIPMDWFFDQWVYGSAIPTYRFSYTLTAQGDGTHKATVRVRQDDVPADFRMLVPIQLDFGAAGTAMVRIEVSGPVTEVELPILPMEPTDIVFNPLEAVLADTKTERWQG